MVKRGNFSRNTKGQITIFIILALIIVAGILVYFLVISPQISGPSEVQKIGIEKCMDDAISEKITELAKTAGYISPKFFTQYNNEKFVYLCYTNQYFKPCVNQQPLLKQYFEQNLLAQVKTDIYSCFDNLISDYKKQGYEVTSAKRDLRLSLETGQVKVEMDAPLTLSKESGRTFTTFKTGVTSNIYSLVMLATTIVQFETTYGDSDITTLMLYYPEYSIDKIRRDDGTLYTITDKISGVKYQFATRSYPWPTGYGVNI